MTLKTDLQPLVDLYIDNRRINTYDYLTSLEIKYDGTIFEGNIELFDPTWTELESIVLTRGINTPINIVYGWSDKPSPQIKCNLSNYEPTFSEEGMRVVAEFTFGSTFVNRVKRNVTWPGTNLISDIVRKIAIKNGWEYDIEPTRGTFDYPLLQNNISDLAFIKSVLIKKAVNTTGVGGYAVTLDNNKLYFTTRHYRRSTVYKTYVVQRGNMGEVINFTPAENVADVAQMGGNKVKTIGFSTKNKTMLSKTLSPDSNSGNDPIVGDKIAEITPRGNRNDPLKIILTPLHTQTDIDNHTQIHYSEFQQQNYMANADIIGDPHIPMFAKLEFIIITPSGVPHYLSGIYTVWSIVHKIDNSGFVTSLELMRSSVSRGDITISGTNIPLTKTSEKQKNIIKKGPSNV